MYLINFGHLVALTERTTACIVRLGTTQTSVAGQPATDIIERYHGIEFFKVLQKPMSPPMCRILVDEIDGALRDVRSPLP